MALESPEPYLLTDKFKVIYVQNKGELLNEIFDRYTCQKDGNLLISRSRFQLNYSGTQFVSGKVIVTNKDRLNKKRTKLRCVGMEEKLMWHINFYIYPIRFVDGVYKKIIQQTEFNFGNGQLINRPSSEQIIQFSKYEL